MKIERASNVTKDLFNNLSISINKIKNIHVYYKDGVNKIKMYF